MRRTGPIDGLSNCITNVTSEAIDQSLATHGPDFLRARKRPRPTPRSFATRPTLSTTPLVTSWMRASVARSTFAVASSSARMLAPCGDGGKEGMVCWTLAKRMQIERLSLRL